MIKNMKRGRLSALLNKSCTWRFQKKKRPTSPSICLARKGTVMAAIRSGAIESMMDEEETDRLTQLIMILIKNSPSALGMTKN